MDEKEVNVSSAPHKRSKSVPAMSPAFLNDSQLQDQPIVGRSRSNTVDSVERLVRTERRGARLSSGGLLRNQSKKRKNKDTLVKSRSVDVIDRDERDNSSRKSSNSSESSVHENDQALVRVRKQGFCSPAVNGVVEKLHIMEEEKEFPNNIDSDQTNSSVVYSVNEENFVGDQQSNTTTILHDDYEASKLSEDTKPYENNYPSNSTDDGQKQENNVQEQPFDFQESNTDIRRKSLPVNVSDYQLDSYLGDYNRGHDSRTSLMNAFQTNMNFENNYRIVYKKRCQNKPWRRWHSLPESLYKVNATTADSCIEQFPARTSLDEREIAVFVEPVDQGLPNMQSSQHKENENCTSESYEAEDNDSMVEKPILKQQDSSNSEEKLDTKDQVEATKRSSKIKRSFSLPLKFDIVDEDERQKKETAELKRTKSLNTGVEFDEVFPVMLSEQAAGFKLEPDIENTDDKIQENDGGEENAVAPKKRSRMKGRDRRRAKSLPVTLALEEIPEESAEQYSCSEYESIEDMAKKHINKAFQELLRKIQSSQRPRNKVKRTRSLSTIKEATASNETLHEIKSCQNDKDITLEKADDKQEEQSTDHEQESADLTFHEHEPDDEQHEAHDNQNEKHADTTAAPNDNEEHQQLVSEESHYQKEENNDDVDLLQQAIKQDLMSTKEEEKAHEEEINNVEEENQDAEDAALALQQALLHENNKAEELQMNKENDEKLDNTTQGTVINEFLNEKVKEEKATIQKAKEELHIEIPEILVSEVEFKQSQSPVVESYDGDVYDEVDGCEESATSDEQDINSQTKELKSPDDEDIQGTILEHINNIEFTFDCNISQRSIVNVSCMERIPEDPDKESAMESAETELEPTENECGESAGMGFDSEDIMEEQSTLKRAGSMRKTKGPRGKKSSSSRKKSFPITNESKRERKRVTWSDDVPETTEGEDEQVDQEDSFQDRYPEDSFQDRYEAGPSGEFTFKGSGDVSEDVTQDEFEEGPRGEMCFTRLLDEHGLPVDQPVEQSDRHESDEIEFEVESKFDILVRNAMSSYLEPDYSQSGSPIHRAVALGNVDRLRELIDEGADVNAPDEHGWPPLHVATLFYKVDCAELLLEAGADLQDYTDSLVQEYQSLRERVC
ncbi:protein PFC0760c-like [Actinia tenebrosa]|uniref:Protein PFC0760c-like n=1 Tax=Actinia tenebrosa TaxID=6105 RepID=A0A6P8HSL6_ACTTE|nr:protein PFC0760c-like [Actinia tenebrosa]